MMLMWKIVVPAEVSVIYIDIYIDNNNEKLLIKILLANVFLAYLFNFVFLLLGCSAQQPVFIKEIYLYRKIYIFYEYVFIFATYEHIFFLFFFSFFFLFFFFEWTLTKKKKLCALFFAS